jgi:hypothetical protein
MSDALNKLFTEWTALSYTAEQQPYLLAVKFENSNGVEKEVKVIPQGSTPEQFSAALFEGDFIVGNFVLTFSGPDDENKLGEYKFGKLESHASREHYATNESPIMTDRDFNNFIDAFHAAIKNWAESQQPKDL